MIAACAFLVMMLISAFAWKVSTVVVLLAAAAVSLAVFLVQERGRGKEGERE